MRRLQLVIASAAVLVACQGKSKDPAPPSGAGAAAAAGSATDPNLPGKAMSLQVDPPLDLKKPPADAIKTSSGLIYKKLSDVPGAPAAGRNDTVMINYTGWRQATGETFFTNRDRGQPMPLPLANTAPGFTEAMQLLRKGERAMLWLPPEIGYKGGPPPGTQPETLVYEVEVTDIVSAPPTPPNLSAPPPEAQELGPGIRCVVVRQGTGTEKPTYYDTVTFYYSAWDQSGRMFDSLEMRKRPATVSPFRQSKAMERVVTSMTAGQRTRCWIPAEQMQMAGKPVPGMPEGVLVYEVELLTITKNKPPWPVPPDVAAPPPGTKKTPKGVSYRVLKPGKGTAKPTTSDSVRVNYTGWTTDGRMFDSSVIKGEPAEFSLQGVIVGWIDAIPMMRVGERTRLWIPDELAYKGSPGKPQGMLVFDVELVQIVAPTNPDAPGQPKASEQPAPSDVKAPPADAKKSPKGVSYKILKAVPGAAHPKVSDSVKVHYTGWTTDGKMFDSSRTRGEPASFALTGVIAGWTDAIPMIGVGESARLWIPQELAYPGGGGPQGMLVFDVELLGIQ